MKKALITVIIVLVLLSTTAYAVVTTINGWITIEDTSKQDNATDIDRFSKDSNVLTTVDEDGNREFQVLEDNKVTEADKKNVTIEIDGFKYSVTVIKQSDGTLFMDVNTSDGNIYTNEQRNRFVLSNRRGDKLYTINPETYEATQITEDLLNGYSIDDYQKVASETRDVIWWALNPQINADGRYLAYSSNKGISAKVPEIQHGLWIYDFKEGKEQQIISGNISQNFFWYENDKIVHDHDEEDGSITLMLYDLSTFTEEKLYNLSPGTYFKVENGYIVSNNSKDNIDLYDINSRKIYNDVYTGRNFNSVNIDNGYAVYAPQQGREGYILVTDLSNMKESKIENPSGTNSIFIEKFEDGVIILNSHSEQNNKSEYLTIDITEDNKEVTPDEKGE